MREKILVGIGFEEVGRINRGASQMTAFIDECISHHEKENNINDNDLKIQPFSLVLSNGINSFGFIDTTEISKLLMMPLPIFLIMI